MKNIFKLAILSLFVANSAFAQLSPPPSKFVGRSFVASNAGTTGTTITPYDNTIPLVTEGDEYLSVTRTCEAGNRYSLNGHITLSSTCSSGSTFTCAVFMNGGFANAVSQYYPSNGNPALIHLGTYGGCSGAATAAVRCGCSNAGTTTLNGVTNLGGGNYSYLEFNEYRP